MVFSRFRRRRTHFTSDNNNDVGSPPSSKYVRDRTTWNIITTRIPWKMILIMILVTSYVMMQFHQSFWSESQYHLNDNDNDDDVSIRKNRRAIFLISMGTAACQSQIVERCVLSIRRGGNWTGPIVLLTDAPPERYEGLVKLQQQQQQQQHGNSYMGSSKSSVVVAAGSGNSSPQQPQLIVLHPRPNDYNTKARGDLLYKRFKTMLLVYTDLDPRLEHVELIYYLDIDIVVGNSLEIFFDYIETKYQIGGHWIHRTGSSSSSSSSGFHPTTSRSNSNNNNNNEYNTIDRIRPPPVATDFSPSSELSTIYFFKGNYDHFPIQSGQYIVERRPSASRVGKPTSYYKQRRPSSQNCLSQWRKLMDEHPTQRRDQKSLTKLYYQTSIHNNNNETQQQTHNNNNHHQKCQLVAMEQLPHLVFPDETYMNETLRKVKNNSNKNNNNGISTKDDDTTAQLVTLNHIKNTHHAKEISDQIQHDFLVKLLRLDDDQVNSNSNNNGDKETPYLTSSNSFLSRLDSGIASKVLFHPMNSAAGKEGTSSSSSSSSSYICTV